MLLAVPSARLSADLIEEYGVKEGNPDFVDSGLVPFLITDVPLCGRIAVLREDELFRDWVSVLNELTRRADVTKPWLEFRPARSECCWMLLADELA